MKYAWIAAAVCILILLTTFAAGKILNRECEDLLALIDDSVYAADHGQTDEAWDHWLEVTGAWEERVLWWHLFVPQGVSAAISALFTTAQEYLVRDEVLLFDVSAAQLQDALANIAADQQLTFYNVL